MMLRSARSQRFWFSHNARSVNRHYASSPKGLEYLQNRNEDWTESQRDVRTAISRLMKPFGDEYWRDIDKHERWPVELHQALARDGWLGICMPEKYGGSGLGLSEACVMMQTIAESGGALTAARSVDINIFSLEPVVRFGTEEQRQRMIPPLIQGKETTCFAVTEPFTGLDTLKLRTSAILHGDKYVVNGRKIWTSTAQTADKVLLLVRTTPLEKVAKATQGLTLFYTTLDRTKVKLEIIPKMGREALDTNHLIMEDWEIPAGDRIGREGDGFKMMMVGMNAERCIAGAECVGVGYVALRRAAQYSTERIVFGREIGQNQGIQHPLADSWMELEAARLMTYQAAKLFDDGIDSGEYANACKYLATKAAFNACERSILTHGGVGYAKEYHVERYLREIFSARIAPISDQLIMCYIAERVLGQKKSY